MRWAAFAATWIRLDTPNGTLEVHPTDQPVPFEGSGGRARLDQPVVVLTAWNPHGRRADPAANEARQRLLISELDAAGRRWWPAVGIAQDGHWWEDSVAVPGLGRSEGRRIGRRWRQEAVFEWNPVEATLAIVACASSRVSVSWASARPVTE